LGVIVTCNVFGLDKASGIEAGEKGHLLAHFSELKALGHSLLLSDLLTLKFVILLHRTVFLFFGFEVFDQVVHFLLALLLSIAAGAFIHSCYFLKHFISKLNRVKDHLAGAYRTRRESLRLLEAERISNFTRIVQSRCPF